MASINVPVSGGVLINAESMASSITSDVMDLSGRTRVGLQLYSSAVGTHVGTIAVQVSNTNTTSNASWNPLTLSRTLAPASTTLFEEHIDLDIAARFLRVVYTATSGTGTLYCYGIATQ